MIYNCPEQKKLVETETYIKLFGGECEIVYDPKQNTFHIHIKNDNTAIVVDVAPSNVSKSKK